FYILLTVGSPVLIGVDRVYFWRNLVPEYLTFVPSLVTQVYFFICFYFLVSLKNKTGISIPSFILAAFIFITIFVLGQKFSAFILIMSAWFMVLSGTFPNFKIKPSQILVAASVTIFIIALVSISYVREGRDASFIFTR